MTSLLEERYRALLRLLPAAYRAEREEEMVAAFLEAARDADELARPSRAEQLGVLDLALRVRLGGVGAPARAFVRGETVRLIALLGVLAQAAWVGHAWLVSGLDRLFGASQVALEMTGDRSLGLLLAMAGEAAWVALPVLLVTGRYGPARLLVLPVLAWEGYRMYAGGTLFFGPAEPLRDAYLAALLLLAVAPALAVAAGFHRDAPPVSARWLTVGLPAGVAALTAGAYLMPWGMQPELGYGVALLAAGVCCLRRWTGTPQLPLALASLAVPVLVAQACSAGLWAQVAAEPVGRFQLAAELAVAVPLAAVTAGLLAAGLRGVRRLPAGAGAVS